MSSAPAGLSQAQIVRRRFWRHRGAIVGLVLLGAVVLLAFTSMGVGPIPGWWAQTGAPGPVANPGGVPTLSMPTWLGGSGFTVGAHPMGQDEVGRDMFAQVMLGVQTSLKVIVVIGLVSALVGVGVGAVAGYYRGWADRLLMRTTDLLITVPTIVIGAVLGKLAGRVSSTLLAVALGLVLWTGLARLVRGELLSLRERDFVTAAQVAGASDGRILFRHLVPNAVGVIIVSTTLLMSAAILLETALSFLGFGVTSPEQSLGRLIDEYQSALATRPWLFWWPGLFIVVIALSINFIGDGLRDAFDPRQQRVPQARRTARAQRLGPRAVRAQRRARATGPVGTPAGDRLAGRVGAPLAAGTPVLSVRELGVDFYVDGHWLPAATGLTYDVHPGEVLAIVGESGSGKTQSAMALLGLLPANGRAAGSARLGGRELIGMPDRGLRRIRGKEVAVVFQEPTTALNPVYTIGFQIVETLRAHLPIGPADARVRAVELLRLVAMPDAERRFGSYPHQLSGGERQRAMIAQALACDPSLLVADEPTTALDVTVQAEILELLRDLRRRIGSGIVLITHDMGVVADLADRMIVMKGGSVVEQGTTVDVFSRPQHPYTRRLLAAVPHLGRTATSPDVGPAPAAATSPDTAPAPAPDTAPAYNFERSLVLQARDLVIEYPGRGRTPPFRGVDGVHLTIERGEVLGLVGESGSGKTTLGRAAVGLLPVTSGELTVAGIPMAGATRKDLAPIRSKIGIVFQDPGSSLNPRLPIGESIAEPLMLHRGLRGKALSAAVERLLDQVHLSKSTRNRYPHELSGGQGQRVAIARALSLEPWLLVADEPTSALDVSVQATVLDLFRELQQEHGFGCLFISHDLAVVEMLSDRVAVMHRGRLVEIGPTAQVVASPHEPYTQRLLAAVPVPDPEAQRRRREARDAMIAAQAEPGPSGM